MARAKPKGRGSNLIGAILSAGGASLSGFGSRAAFTAAGFAAAALAAGGACLGAAGDAAAGNGLAAAGLAATGLELGLDGFTFTFDVAMGMGLAGGFTAFLGATFGVAFLIVALPGRLAALLGFFEGI
jgi:hypothetical protein